MKCSFLLVTHVVYAHVNIHAPHHVYPRRLGLALHVASTMLLVND